ncbi:hypothetical protein CC78DRAFT_138440 [Lojkania enalia]|uniref:Uncharacterized protein n=1 Tax=Lojkania enalia TaxID=147567 RepID=A0A9P4TRJ1_9PLEO|nr:hypothetical protein CC78DRAFT_138440 [Didymosphaeria enalia]
MPFLLLHSIARIEISFGEMVCVQADYAHVHGTRRGLWSTSRYASRFRFRLDVNNTKPSHHHQPITQAQAAQTPNRSLFKPMPTGFNTQMPRRIGWLRGHHLTQPSLSRYGLDGPRRSRTCHTAARTPPPPSHHSIHKTHLPGPSSLSSSHRTPFAFPESGRPGPVYLRIHVACICWPRFRIQ